MLGAEDGFPNIDGVDEGLIDGSTLCVGTLLGCLLGDTDCVGTILGVRDILIDSKGISLGSVVGGTLMTGPMLGAEKGSTDIDGVDEDDDVLDGSVLVVGSNILDFNDGAIDSDGNPLGSVVGVRLSIGPMLDTEEGSADIDGVDE
eukprot:scaffold90936_cov89-Attheya_sp.AAC.4